MAEGKKSFVLYTDLIEVTEELTNEEAGLLFKTILRYVNDLNPEIPKEIKLAFIPIRQDLKRDLKKYEAQVERMQRINDKRRRDKEQQPSNEIVTTSKRNRNDIVGVNDNVSVNDNDNDVSKDTNNINRSSKLDRYADLRKQILDYLNDSIGSHYRDCKANKRLIDSRLDDGYTLEDFKHVIDVKAYQWKDSDLQKYLRPETLFCASHFESYLNEEKQTGVKNNPFDLPDAGFRSL